MWKRAGMAFVILLALTTIAVADHQWSFNALNGTGGVTRPEVMKALDLHNLSVEEAQALTFTCVDFVGTCMRTRELRTFVRTSGNDSRVTGFWFFGYGGDPGGCEPGPGENWAIYVNGFLIE